LSTIRRLLHKIVLTLVTFGFGVAGLILFEERRDLLACDRWEAFEKSWIVSPDSR
jgi:hypothetical protein